MFPISNGMKILITTGIYPPKIGGPAQYSKNLKLSFEKVGHKVRVATFSIENYLPTGLRHVYFFIKIVRQVISADLVVAMDTFSVGLPSVISSKVFGKKIIIRTGGDFLWEQYVERTKKKVLLRNFYQTEKNNFSLKEKIIFSVTRWTLQNASHIIFSTDFQRDIFKEAYSLDVGKTSIVENYYGPKESDNKAENRTFIGSSRHLVWKNLDMLEEVFVGLDSVKLFLETLPFPEFMNKIQYSYAVILISLGDISPNMILDAIRYNRPFICTKEVGIYNRIKDAGIFVDPLSQAEIKHAVLSLLDSHNYQIAQQKVRQFSFIHTWEEIADEFLTVYGSLK